VTNRPESTRCRRRRPAARGQRVEGHRMNSRGMTRVIHRLVESHAATRAVISCWSFSGCPSGGCTHPNSTSGTPSEPHPNDDGRPGEHGKYEQCKKPKDRGPVDKACRHTDAACPDNKAKSCKSLPQTISNCHALHILPSNFSSGRADDADSCSAVIFRSRPILVKNSTWRFDRKIRRL